MFKLFSFFFFQALLVSRLLGQDLFEQSNDLLVREIDDTYRKGLGFLAGSQNDRGCWSDSSYGSEPGVVGMCILAFLARGDDPEFGPYRSHYKKALDYLLKAQNTKTGYIGSSMYNHGFSTLALAEAYGLTNDLRLGPALEKATKLIVSSQKNNPKGGWRYSPESQDADTTVSGPKWLPSLPPATQESRFPRKRSREARPTFFPVRIRGRLRIHHFQRGQLAPYSHRFTHSFPRQGHRFGRLQKLSRVPQRVRQIRRPRA